MEKNIKEKNTEPTYEQLKYFVDQLATQNRALREQVMHLSNEASYKRMDYLFKVIEYNEMFSGDFISKCISEIQEALTIENDTEDADAKES